MDMNEVYSRLDEMFAGGQGAKAEDYLIDKMKQAQDEGDYNSLIMLLNEMIGYCRETSQKEKSLAYSGQVIQLMQQLGLADSVAYATTLLNVANECRAAGKTDEAYRFYMEVLPIYDKYLAPGDFYYAGLYNNMSLLFQETGEYEKSVECLEKALRIVENIPGAEFEVAVTHTNIASSLCKLSEEADREEERLHFEKSALGYDKGKQIAIEALEEAKKAVEAFRSMEVTDVHMAAACNAYADALALLHNYTQAQEYYCLAMEMIERAVGRTEGYARVAQKLAHVQEAANEGQLQAPTQVKEMKGLALSRAYFDAYGKKMLFDEFRDYLPQIAAGLCGEGSDCLGYDDGYSADHDFGPGFALWVSDEVYEQIGERLKAAYDRLPRRFMGYERVETPQAQGRCGVCTYRQYLTRILGLDHVPQNDSEWLYVDEEALCAAVSGEVFTDPAGEFTNIRKRLSAGYPESVRRLKMAQQMTLFSQNGQYNYERMMKRGDRATANLLLAKAGENAMRLVYLLNRQYAPHTKWLLRGIEDMDEPAMAEDLITNLLYEIGCRENEVSGKVLQLEKIAVILLEQMKKQGLIAPDAKDTYLAHYAVQVAYGSAAGQQMQETKRRMQEAEAEREMLRKPSAKAETEEVTQKAEMIQIEEVAQTEENIVTSAKNVNEKESGEVMEVKTDEKPYTKEEMVDAIVQMEWKAFDQVKNEGGRADCQDDWTTFQIMRKSQYLTWDEEMLGQYIYDFQNNIEKGWNPITEKYARMMESTAKEEYDKLKENLPEVSEQKKQIMEQIIEIQVDWMENFASAYPKVASGARVIHTSEDGPYETSYETYLRGELGTYSDDMLMLYGRFIAKLAKEGKNLAAMTMEHTVHMYGYDDLESAEAKMW